MSEIGIPLPPVEPTEPSPPITPEPPQRDSTVRPPVEPSPTPSPAPPVEPELPPSGGGGGGFPDLWDFAALLLVLGIVALLFYFTGLVNFILKLVWGTFGRGGSAPQLSQTQLGQPVSSLLAPYVTSRDAQFGADFALMGATVARVGRAILAAEETLYHAVSTFLPLQTDISNVNKARVHLSQRVSNNEAAQDAAAKAAAQAQANARLRAHGLSQRLDEIEKDLGAVVITQHELVRHAIPELRRGQATAWDEIVKHNEALGAAGLALGVASSLANLGGNWIRCESSQAVGEAICRSNPNRLKNLLNDLLPLIGIAELCGLVKLVAQAGRNPVILGALGVITTGVEDLLTCTGATKPTPLAVPAPSVGPPIAYASLTPTGV